MRSALAAAVLTLAGLCGAARAASCSVTTAGVAFGAYDFLSPAPLDSSGTLSWSCDVPTSLTIALGKGAAPTYHPRRLLSAASGADYNLFLDAACTEVWGDGSDTTGTWAGSGTGSTVPVYGRVPARQTLSAGAYADTIVVTIMF